MAKVFTGGMPYEADVNALLAQYPKDALKVGNEITHNEVERTTSCKYGTQRYYAVTRCWQRKVRETHGVIVGSVKGVGFRVLNDVEKVSKSERHFKTALHHARTGIRVLNHVNLRNLDADAVGRFELSQRRHACIASASLIKPSSELPAL